MPPPAKNGDADVLGRRIQSNESSPDTGTARSPAQARSVLVETPLARWWRARRRERSGGQRAHELF
jgi:hypothetical protein